MNAVEIEAAVSELSAAEYDAAEFPFQFLSAFDKKETTLKRLRKGDSNKSDVPGGVLLINNIHLVTCTAGHTRQALDQLKASPKTASARAKFIFATDGSYFDAEDVTGAQEPVADRLANLANHFGFFLPLAGISTVREIKDNPIDVRATGRLNKLYVELLRANPEWGDAARRHDMNHFMARLIFCFFAEDTDIFLHRGRFTGTMEQMSESDGSNVHQVMQAVFRAMNVRLADRAVSGLPAYADVFPYVNGGLFSGSTEVPRFTRIARSYLLQAGALNWQAINPDIFGSMIQAVADEAERGALGMHYTSVPNILKVLNPLFLDDLRAQMETAGENARMLLHLRQRMSRIRVFDPACGSGNFLVIAYKQMRSIEAEINRRRGEAMRPTDISKKNFRGIELRDFAAEIARLALVIAEYQCDVQHRGPLAAKAEFLPLDEMNWITCGNALRLDWLQVCPPEGTSVKLHSDDLFQTPLEQPEIDFENEGGETFICGNPPYVGRRNQTTDQKDDLKNLLSNRIDSSASLDYVFGWIEKASDYARETGANLAFVTTNSVTQGTQIPIYWPHLLSKGLVINFAHRSFSWSNNAVHNAGVICVIVGLGAPRRQKWIFDGDECYEAKTINPYLLPSETQVVETAPRPLCGLPKMNYGNLPGDGNHLTISADDRRQLASRNPEVAHMVLPLYGAQELIRGLHRYCLWIDDEQLHIARSNDFINDRINRVHELRISSKDPSYQGLAHRPHQFRDRNLATERTILAPTICSESRSFLPFAVFPGSTCTTNQAYALYDAPLWTAAILGSQLHLAWIATVCGKLKTDYRYSNTLGWNTFPVPTLTDQNKADLTRCAEDILLAREAHFPATIADLYDPDDMPDNLRAAHEANDDVLERIYIGRRFRNDTERLEKLFEMYTKMTAGERGSPAGMTTKRGRAKGKAKASAEANANAEAKANA